MRRSSAARNADTLVGTSGNDIIIGNGGNDTITGGLGADTLTGGSGKVTFVYNSSSDTTPSSHDTITDFNASRDKIDFTNIAGINANDGIATFEGKLTGSGNLTLNAHSVAYIEVNGNTEVLVNTTNTAETVTSSNVSAANMEIVLVGIHLGLKAADFYHITALFANYMATSFVSAPAGHGGTLITDALQPEQQLLLSHPHA